MGKSADEMTPSATDRAQDDIRHTEAKISGTLLQIEEKFTPEHIRAQIKEKTLHYALVGYIKVSDAVRKKPVPAALIGAGAAWFLVRRLTHRGRKGHGVEAVAAVAETLPRKARHHPVETIKHYITVGRLVIAAASAVSAVLLREKPAGGHPRRQAGGELPATGAYAGMPEPSVEKPGMQVR